MPESVIDQKTFEELVKAPQLTVVHFSATWVEQCKQVNDVIDALAKQPEYSDVKFVKCEAEDLAEVSLLYKIEAAPTTLIFRAGDVLDRIEGVDPNALTQKVKEYAKSDMNNVGESKSNLNDRLKDLINKEKIVLFMKGNPDDPKCGFSKQIVALLHTKGVQFGHFDILTDEEVRQGLKVYSDWPTYPQLYIKGELIGGLDIVREMDASGELDTMLTE